MQQAQHPQNNIDKQQNNTIKNRALLGNTTLEHTHTLKLQPHPRN